MERFYTLWRKHGTNVELMDTEPTFNTKSAAFKRAKVLQKDLVYGGSDSILVRRITVGTRVATQWEFAPLS